MKKKLFSIIIAVCLVIATVPTIAFASNSQSTSPIKIRVAPSEHENRVGMLNGVRVLNRAYRQHGKILTTTATATSGGK